MSEQISSLQKLSKTAQTPQSASSIAAPPQPPPAISRVPKAPATMVRYKRILGRLTKIEIENYRGFSGRFDLDLPDGCNLLVYGENGVGKSSLFQTLADFFESPYRRFYDEKLKTARPLRFDDHRHRFNSDPGAIRLNFSASVSSAGGPPTIQTYEWSASKQDPRLPVMRIVDNGKGFLDYKALLRIQLLAKGEDKINLFDLFVDPLLAYYKNPASSPSLTFGQEWNRITSAFAPRVWKPPKLNDWIAEFNAGFERVVKDSVALASQLLADFDKELAIEIEFTPASYVWNPKKLISPKIAAKPSFRRLQGTDYYTFLNEARLSALAIAIYFAGLKESPAADLRLLVLDDLLIGLDMANRMAMLRIAERLFPDWQLIVLTYHKPWFEILKARTQYGNWRFPWKGVTFRLGRAVGVTAPIILADSGTLLAQARVHLSDQGDAKAAAVYARSAWEAAMSWYCADMHLPVTYVESRRELDTDAFLSTIAKQLETLCNRKDREWARAVLQEIKHARRFILNPHAHYDPDLEDEIRAEIEAGIRAVEDFEILLRGLQKSDFSRANELSEDIGVADVLCSALKYVPAKQNAAALDALARAFELHVREWFRWLDVKVPFGIELTREFLFDWAGNAPPFTGMMWVRLKRTERYLVGKVSPEKLDPVAFESAAKLLSELRLDFLLRKKLGKLGNLK